MKTYPFHHGRYEFTSVMACSYVETSKDTYRIDVDGEPEPTLVTYLGKDQWQVTRPGGQTVVITDRGTAATATAAVIGAEEA